MATNLGSLWERLSPMMDSAIDATLGDRVDYALDGSTFVSQPAFVIIETDGDNDVRGLDDIDVRKRIKINKAIVAEPSLAHRIRHPKLGAGTYRPTNSLPQTEGRYWLFDVQKAN